MKKHLLLLAAIITFSYVGAQDNNAWLQSRVLKVDPADVEKFEAAVAKKTKSAKRKLDKEYYSLPTVLIYASK